MSPIGIFDSGYGGLTILRTIRQLMPQYDYLYLGDNARAPYGTRSFEVVYEFTLQAVKRLFQEGCPLVILGCNTASAKALRTIQQRDLATLDATRRVLGVIRPTAECVGHITQTRHVGIFATPGTIRSCTYNLEIAKLHPDIQVTGVACPMWVPLVENNEANSPGADYFVRQKVDELFSCDPLIDTIILGCTHYPLLKRCIGMTVGESICLVDPAKATARRVMNFLREKDLLNEKETNGSKQFYLSDSTDMFQFICQKALKHGYQAEIIDIEKY
jgi:glutamate racemase